MIKGIDISEHNGVIDFEKVAKAGIEFVMIRAGYGKNNIDDQFIRNIQMCNLLNIPCGVYWFSYALNEAEAKQEALYCLNAIKPYRVEYPVCFDLEYDTIRYARDKGVTINKTLASKFVVAFCSTIEANKYYAMNYANLDYSNNMFDNTVSRYNLWFARWGVSEPGKTCGIWQYSDKGSVDGIGSGVDLDYSYIDFPSVIKAKGLNNLPQPQPSNWKLDNLKKLYDAGIISDYDGWAAKIDENIPVWAVVTMIANMLKGSDK